MRREKMEKSKEDSGREILGEGVGTPFFFGEFGDSPASKRKGLPNQKSPFPRGELPQEPRCHCPRNCPPSLKRRTVFQTVALHIRTVYFIIPTLKNPCQAYSMHTTPHVRSNVTCYVTFACCGTCEPKAHAPMAQILRQRRTRPLARNQDTILQRDVSPPLRRVADEATTILFLYYFCAKLPGLDSNQGTRLQRARSYR